MGMLGDGGHHRPFHQRLRLSLEGWTAAPVESYKIIANAALFLPLTEDSFIDADDPLLADYDGARCRASVDTNVVRGGPTTCNIRFSHPETIDIKQPVSASRQHVVAYRVALALTATPDAEAAEGLDVVVEYGTTLHLRYPPPISDGNNRAENGVVPVDVPHPMLHSASMSLEHEDKPGTPAHYALPPDGMEVLLNSPDPIAIHVAAGLDSDYWWTTVVTMAASLVGGVVLMDSLDSVSTWC